MNWTPGGTFEFKILGFQINDVELIQFVSNRKLPIF